MEKTVAAEWQSIDFNSLKQALVVNLPTDLASTLKVNQSLAYPPDFVKNITTKQVDSLQNIFDIADEDKFSEWWHVYSHINIIHSQGNEIRSGENRARGLRQSFHDAQAMAASV
jgi:hypothetical protein